MSFFSFFRKKGLCVLMYHHVGPVTDPKEERFFIDSELFAKQIDFLLENKFYPVSLKEVEVAFEQKKKLPENSVLITLDDGWLDNYLYAFPVLKEKKVPATIFITPGLVGKNKDLLSWEQITEMHESGVIQFASHAHNHKRLRDLSDEDILYELRESKKSLEEFFKQPVISFCYPYGAVDKRVRKLVFQAGYSIDFGTRKGINSWPWEGRRPLLRAHVMAGESLNDFNKELLNGRK